MQQNLLIVGHRHLKKFAAAKHRHHSLGPIKFSRFPIPVGIFALQIFLLLLLLHFPLAMSAIPASWEKCPDQGSCQNEGVCYSDGMSEFCICPDGFVGHKCERLVDAIFFLDSPLSSEQLARLCKIAFMLGICALLIAIFGWGCCCLKHLNARRLYLQNLKLARENRHLHEGNQRLSKRTIRLYAALARARGLIGAEEGGEDFGLQQHIISVDSTPSTEYSTGGPIRSNRAISSDSRHSLGQLNNGNPNHRVLLRELSEMHDELRKSIEGADRIVEILEKEEEVDAETSNNKMPNWRWDWERLKGRILLFKGLKKEAVEEEGECARLENGKGERRQKGEDGGGNRSIFGRLMNR